MEVVSVLDSVRSVATRGGSTRYVARDAEGNEYTTFREAIGERAKELEGTRVRITYHREQRGQYENVYLDKLEPVGSGDAQGETEVQEAAWRTAVEAAPWLVGEPGDQVSPEELYDKLKPFEDRVASDIREGREDEDRPSGHR